MDYNEITQAQAYYVKKSLFVIEKNEHNFKILKRTPNGLTETHEYMGVFKVESLESIINELLEETEYITISNEIRAIKIIERV